MSQYRGTHTRKDSVSSRWSHNSETLRDGKSSPSSRPGVITLPSSEHSAQSAGQAAAQMAALKTRFPDLSNSDMTDIINQFHAIPSSKAGWITQKSAITAVQTLNNASYDHARETMKSLHADATSKLELDDWIEFSVRMRSDTPSTMVPGKRSGTFQMRGAEDHISHTINEDEKIEYIDYINSKLASDPDVGSRLPIPSDTMQVFDECRDGLIICKLIEHVFPGTIHSVMNRSSKGSRKSARNYLNFPSADKGLNRFKSAENNNVAVRAAEAIGANVVNISGQDLAEGREHLILSLLGQIIRLAASGRPRPSPMQRPRYSPKQTPSFSPWRQPPRSPPSPMGSEKSIPPLFLDDDDEPTRVPTPTSFNFRQEHRTDRDRVAELGLRNKLMERGTYNLFEDVKGGIIILQTLEKTSPPKKTWIPSQSTPRKYNSSRPLSPTPSFKHAARPTSPTPARHGGRPMSPSSGNFTIRPSSPATGRLATRPSHPIHPIQPKQIQSYQSPLLRARQSSAPSIMTKDKEPGPPPTHGIDAGTIAQRRALLFSITNRP